MRARTKYNNLTVISDRVRARRIAFLTTVPFARARGITPSVIDYTQLLLVLLMWAPTSGTLPDLLWALVTYFCSLCMTDMYVYYYY